jgi:transposase
MKKVSTVAAKQIRNSSEQKLTIGLDLGDRSSWYCVLNEAGEVLLEQRLTQLQKPFLLTLEDPHRFRKSRDVGCYLGLQPGRRNSGESEPQMHISKEGDPYLRTLLVQGAHHILGPFGADSDVRRWGLKLAERGGRNGKKRAVIATARKLAVLLHRLWVSGEVYEPLRNSNQRAMPAAA